MKYIFYALSFIIVILFEMTISDLLSIRGISPHFSIVVLAYVGLVEGRARSTTIGFVFGLFQDLAGSGLIGLNALTKSVIGFFFGQFVGLSRTHRILVPGLIIFMADLIHNFLVALFVPNVPFGTVLIKAVLAGIYTSLVGMIIFAFLTESAWRRIEMVEEPF
jgi:rod shape-determining protein MreD